MTLAPQLALVGENEAGWRLVESTSTFSLSGVGHAGTDHKTCAFTWEINELNELNFEILPLSKIKKSD